MPLNLGALSGGSAKARLVPRDIYNALPKRPWPYLRHEQGEVLERWFDRRDERDVVIKQNTGGGKTAAGLLIARSSLNEGVAPVAYLAPDRYLVAQVKAEAAKLGIPTVDEPRSPAFIGGDAVLVTTLHKVINGLSVFGVVGGSNPVQNLGTVIVDDAHAALAATEGQFRLTIPHTHAAYTKLTAIFGGTLETQARTTWRSIEEKDPSAVLPIPFWVWADRQAEVVDALHPHRGDQELRFVWALVEHVLPICTVTISSASVEIRPPCPPINRIPAFHNAKRRVYLTATLADDSVLVTDLDADPKLVAKPVTPGRAADLGDRIILAPLELNPSLGAEGVRQLAHGYSTGDLDGDGTPEREPVNVVVLVPGDWAVTAWQPYAARVFHVGDLEAGVAELKAGHVGLVVLVNKYDGIDLPGDACRLLVIDGLPRALDAAERREAAVLYGSPTLVARQVQRVEQGMGRGVRDVNDYCAVLLMGTDLTRVVHDPAYRALLSPATQAQVGLSREVAAQIEGEGLPAVAEAINTCLDRDTDWVELSRNRLADVEYAKTGTVTDTAVALRKAFDMAASGQYADAANAVQGAADRTESDAERGWLMEQQAAYQHLADPMKAQAVLAAATIRNPHVLRPAAGVPVSRIKAAAVQARAAADFLGHAYHDGVSLVLGVRALLDAIRWEEAATDDAEAGFERLGHHLGFASERPERRYGTGPDNLWALTGDRHAVIELKTGSRAPQIGKHDADQLGGSVRWHEENYDDVAAVPVLVHPQRTCSDQATLPAGTRVITPDKLDGLKEAVISFAVALAQDSGHWRDQSIVAEQLAHHKLTGGTLLGAHTYQAQ